MALRVVKAEPTAERQTIVGMIMQKSILGPIAARWAPPGFFASAWLNLIGTWAVEHYRKYGAAPKGAIENYYRVWAEEHSGERDTIDMIGQLLVSLDDEWDRLRERMEPDHLMDVAEDLFNRVVLKRDLERATAYADTGQVDKAREVLDRSRKVEIGANAGLDVFTADAEFEHAIEHAKERLIEYEPGSALHGFFGDTFYRGGFVALWGKQKIGKSYLLQELVWTAVEQKRRVAYFECGDSTQQEVLERLAARIAGRPIEAERYRVPLTMQTYPETRKPADVTFDDRETFERMSPVEERRARRELGRRVGVDRFKLSCHSSLSLSVERAESILDVWQRDDWFPDVIVFDYADIMAPSESVRRMEKRDQVNDTWIRLRRLSQERHCLVLTLSQIKADEFKEWLLDRSAFGEDNRKLSHPTSVIGINQSPQEKENGCYRLNYIVGRTLKFFSEKKCLYTAGCLAIGRPFVLSSF